MKRNIISAIMVLLLAPCAWAADNAGYTADNDCITFTSADAFTLKTANLAKNWDVGMQWSTDKLTWREWNGEEIAAGQAGDAYNLHVRGDGNTVVTGCYKTKRWVLTPAGNNKVACTGNIETLRGASGDTPPTAPMAEGCYHSLFFECTALTTAPSIGETTLSFGCCDCMYAGCSSLTDAPELAPAVVSGNGYKCMFLNCTSLKTASALPATTLGSYCYYEMYKGCSALTNAPALPATTLAQGCYGSMFRECTALMTPPVALPATVLATECYHSMFLGCTALTNTPAIAATTLATGCCDCMFTDCSALTEAPALPAKAMTENGYKRMFLNCTSLKTASALPATALGSYCYYEMYKGCSALTNAPALPASTLTQGCYGAMFRECTELSSVSETLPATILATECYHSMFLGCTSLTNAPALAATTLAQGCCDCMFAGCSALTKAPELPAKTMAVNGYKRMFLDCTSLTTPPALPATVLAECCYNEMFKNCTSLEVETAAPGVAWSVPANATAANNWNTDMFVGTGGGFTGNPDVGTTYYIASATAVIDNDCITFTSTGAFTLKTANLAKNWDVGMQWSTNKLTWTEWSGEEISAAQIDGAGSYQLYVRGDENTIVTGEHGLQKCWMLSPVGDNKVACTGNLETLRGAMGNRPSATKMATMCYFHMFYNCKSLTTPPTLPATTLADNCYAWMFCGCTSLTMAPALPATQLSYGCYCHMFDGCSSLTSVPTLPATTMASYCYSSMFRGCTSLTVAPSLPATKLATMCYGYMFDDCKALSSPPALPATQLSYGCYRGMFDGCSSLTSVPTLPATKMTTSCYELMFRSCRCLKVNMAPPGKAWSIPAGATTASSWNTDMFTSTGGDFKYSPAIGVTYYVASTRVTIEPQVAEHAHCFRVFTNNTIEVAAPYTVIWGNTVKIVYTADEGYAFPGGGTTFTTNVVANADTVTVTLAEDQCPQATIDNDCITFASTGTFTLKTANLAKNWDVGMQWSTDKLVWMEWTGEEISAAQIGGAGDYKLHVRGDGNAVVTGSSSSKKWVLTPSGANGIVCAGNIETLRGASGDRPSAVKMSDGCYSFMFDGCTPLTTVPSLTATEMAGCCYEGMFKDCTSLMVNKAAPGREWSISAGATPATNWNTDMFAGTGGDFTGSPAIGVAYYVASAKATIEPHMVEHSTFKVYSSDMYEINEPFAVAWGSTATVVYKADAGYEFPNGRTTLMTNIVANSDTVEVSPAENQRPQKISSVASWKDAYMATGDLNKTVKKSTLNFNISVTKCYTKINSARLEITAYNVSYPSSDERDDVYFNGSLVGRLMGKPAAYAVTSFDISPSSVNVPSASGSVANNTIAVKVDVDSGCFIATIKSAKLIINGEVEGIKLTASDATDTQGVDVKWDNVSGCTFDLYRSDKLDGDYTRIAQNIPHNTWLDRTAQFGQVYYYYVEATPKLAVKLAASALPLPKLTTASLVTRVSNRDDGRKKSSANTPRIKKIVPASLWLTEEGPYNMRIYWEKFNPDEYPVKSIKLKLCGGNSANGTVERSFVVKGLDIRTDEEGNITPWDINLMDYPETEASCTPFEAGEHGSYDITATVTYHSGDVDIDQLPEHGTADVYFSKYGKKAGVANWYRYWIRDGVIPNPTEYFPEKESDYLYNGDDGTKKDELFHYRNDPDGRGHTVCDHSPFEVESYFKDLPHIYKKKAGIIEYYWIADLGAARGQELPLASGKKVGIETLGGVYKVASLVSHEQKHGELWKRLFAQGKYILRMHSASTIRWHNGIDIDAVMSRATELANAKDEVFFASYLSTLMSLKASGDYVLDSDGDGLLDDDEKNGIDGLTMFDISDPDSLGLAALNDHFYDKNGDSEAVAREAEKTPAFNPVVDNDWAFPGFKVGGKDAKGKYYASYYPWVRQDNKIPSDAIWQTVQTGIRKKLQEDCFVDLRSSPLATKFLFTENLSKSLLTASNNESQDGWSRMSGMLSQLGDWSDSNHEYDYPIQATNATLVDQTADSLLYAITVKNLATQELHVVASGYLMDSASNAVAWTESSGTIGAGVSTINLIFDGKLLAEKEGAGYRLFGFKVFDGSDNPNGWGIAHHVDIAGDGAYSASDFTPRAATIYDATSDEVVDGDLIASIPLKVCEAGAYTVSAAIIDTNKQQICLVSVSNSFAVGKHSVQLTFSGDEIRRANLNGPYIVTSLEVSRAGEVIHEMDGAYETSAYVASQMGDRSDCLLEFSGWKQVDTLSFGSVVVNSADRSICYRTTALLRSANGTPVSTYDQYNVLQPGLNELTIAFSDSDFASSTAEGPYSVKEVSFEPVDDEDAVEEHFPITMTAVEINKAELSAAYLDVTGSPTITAGRDEVFAYLDIPICVSNASIVTTCLTLTNSSGEAVISHKLTASVTSDGNQTVRFEIPSEGLTASQDGGGTYTICDVSIGLADSAIVIELSDCSASLTSNQPALSQFLYVMGEDGYILVGAKSSLIGTLNVPSTYNGIPVVEIADSAFYSYKSLTAVVIPDSVRTVGEGAFAYCTSLSSIKVSEGSPYLSIVDGVLYDKAMTKLLSSIGTIKSVNIPSGVRIIEGKAFYGCAALTSVSIPIGVTTIGEYAFGSTALSAVTLPNGLTSIGDRAFAFCTSLETVSVPDSVTSIGSKAFYFCYRLQGPLKLPKNLTAIAASTFEDCHSLTEVEIPEGVTDIGDNAFDTCALYSVTIPKSVLFIGNWAFYGCSLMSSVTIREGVIDIGEYAFGYCRAMASVSLPATLESIGENTFYHCTTLTEILVSSESESFMSMAGSLYGKKDLKLICCPAGKEALDVPDGISCIGASACAGSESLASVTIPGSVTNIGEKAFYECSKLASVTMQKGVASIGEFAFAYCSALKTITIPDSVESVGKYAFRTGLTSVDFEGAPPNGLSSASIPTSAAIRYNAKFASEWSSVISACKFTNATPYTPDSYAIPELPENPTAEQISDALQGSEDDRLSINITDEENYNAYRDWASKVKASDGSAVAGAGAVKAAPNAWMSFALDSDKLLEQPPTDEDLTVEKFEPASESGKFDFTVSVDGVNVGSDAQKENLMQIFGLEGATTLNPNDFSSGNIDLTFGTPADGKVKFTAGPKDTSTSTFFMKVKVNP